MGRETCVPAKKIARLDPGTLMAGLVSPELRPSAFRPSLTPAQRDRAVFKRPVEQLAQER